MKVLVTAGPTHEPIDTVRFIGNRSSGRMGVSLAAESASRGHETTLLLGPSTVEPPDLSHLTVHRFSTIDDLRRLLLEHVSRADLLLMAAAVADFRPSAEAAGNGPEKISRSTHSITLTLEPTPDLLSEIAEIAIGSPHGGPPAAAGSDESGSLSDRRKQSDHKLPIRIGFALEPRDRVESSAMEKLSRKKLDAIVANPLETMDSTTVTATIYRRDGSAMKPPADLDKRRFAAWLFDHLDDIFTCKGRD